VLLVFALARKLTRRFEVAIFVAAIWAVHPLLTESVTNIVGRADLISAMATLGGLLIYRALREERLGGDAYSG